MIEINKQYHTIKIINITHSVENVVINSSFELNPL